VQLATLCQQRLLPAASASNRSYQRTNYTFWNKNRAGANSKLITLVACAAYSVGLWWWHSLGKNVVTHYVNAVWYIYVQNANVPYNDRTSLNYIVKYWHRALKVSKKNSGERKKNSFQQSKTFASQLNCSYVYVSIHLSLTWLVILVFFNSHLKMGSGSDYKLKRSTIHISLHDNANTGSSLNFIMLFIMRINLKFSI
jgi:hypothetical protein